MTTGASVHNQISSILNSDQFDEAEKWIVKWQYNRLGDFQKALANAITRADDDNLESLALGFPMQVNAYRRWALGGVPSIAPKLRATGLDI